MISNGIVMKPISYCFAYRAIELKWKGKHFSFRNPAKNSDMYASVGGGGVGATNANRRQCVQNSNDPRANGEQQAPVADIVAVMGHVAQVALLNKLVQINGN